MHAPARPLPLVVLAAVALSVALPAAAQPVTIRPGAPGQPSRVIAPEVPTAPAAATANAADVRFMQGMIGHHAQALEMTALARTRTTTPALLTLAEKIEVAQGDEIAWMRRWLLDRGQDAPQGPHVMPHGAPDAPPAAHHGMQHGDDAQADTPGMTHADHALMPGMLNADEMADLAAARGRAFDRLFLKYMIRHHEGGLIMVADLLAAPGGAQAADVYRLATDIDADQRADIQRMLEMLDVPRLPSILPPR